MKIQKTSLPFQRLQAARPTQVIQQEPPQSKDTVTFSSRNDNAGWKIAGMTLIMASVPMGIAAKSAAVGAIGVLAGAGLMFGPDI